MMNRYSMKKNMCLIGCIVLVAAMALSFIGCGSSPAAETTDAIGFVVEITDLEGNTTSLDLISDKATIGEALQEKGLLEGEEGPYGLYIKSVNGIELDWDTHQKYWAFYVDGEYALAGVDQTEITEGAVYSFKPEG